MTQMLASVANAQEALIALRADVDIIDLKNPAEGALGTLPISVIREIVAIINQRTLTSATIGDLPMQPELLVEAIEKTAATGVDMVKVGFFASDHPRACLAAMKPLSARGLRLIAVFFADGKPDFELLPHLSETGFYGVMLDTVNKTNLNLMQCISVEKLQQFINLARKHRLQSGLAGSIHAGHLPQIHILNPDFVGFRGALCSNSKRESALENVKVLELRKLLRRCNISPSNLLQA